MARLIPTADPEPSAGGFPDRLTIGFIGSGRAARALGHGLARAGHEIVLARRSQSAARLAGRLRARLETAEGVLGESDLTVLAVPDAAITPTATELALTAPDGDGRAVVHLSGSRGPELLEPLRERGYRTAALHPLQVLSGWRIPPGTSFAVAGNAQVSALLSRIVADLGGLELEVAGASRQAYHAAAVIAANLGMTLLAEAVDLMARSGIDREAALAGLAGLVRGGLEASLDRGLPAALTGPVTRGDVETVLGHLQLLAEDPDLLRAYRDVSLLTLRQARRDQRPGDEPARELLRVLTSEPPFSAEAEEGTR